MKRETSYVTDSDGVHWLPRPSSWMAGLLRHRWFEHHVGPARVAAPDRWRALAAAHGVSTLVEHADGHLTIDRR
jgi:hypothetical protein